MLFWLVFAAIAGKAGAGPAYPLKASPNGRYLLDANNAPFLMIGDAPHSLIVNLNSADAAAYLIDRGSNGFNSLWVECLCNSYTGGPGTDGTANYGHDINHNNPFTSTLPGGYYDLTTPNPAYWSHVDSIVQTAAANGLQLCLTPLDQGGWTTTSLVNGPDRCYQYGQFLGNRYKNSPNVFWLMGNDFQNWSTATNDAVILAIANGIKSVDTTHPMTIELDYRVSDSLADPNWAPEVSVNGIYTYYPTYAESLVGYNRANFSPCLFLEANYEYENDTGGQPYSPLVLRLQEYWSLLGGCLAGHLYGNLYTWTFDNGWQSNLDTIGVTHLMYFKNFFASVPWYNLVPDQAHRLVTAGYGRYDAGTDTLTSNNYVTAAQTSDGTLGVAYSPTSATLTVCMTNFAGPVTARWFDPTAATFTAVSGSPFANTLAAVSLTTPGSNSRGDSDWVLLLETGASAQDAGPNVNVAAMDYPLHERFSNPQRFACSANLPTLFGTDLESLWGAVATDGDGRIAGLAHVRVYFDGPANHVTDYGAYAVTVTGTTGDQGTNPLVKITMRGNGYEFDGLSDHPNATLSLKFVSTNRLVDVPATPVTIDSANYSITYADGTTQSFGDGPQTKTNSAFTFLSGTIRGNIKPGSQSQVNGGKRMAITENGALFTAGTNWLVVNGTNFVEQHLNGGLVLEVLTNIDAQVLRPVPGSRLYATASVGSLMEPALGTGSANTNTLKWSGNFNGVTFAHGLRLQANGKLGPLIVGYDPTTDTTSFPSGYIPRIAPKAIQDMTITGGRIFGQKVQRTQGVSVPQPPVGGPGG